MLCANNSTNIHRHDCSSIEIFFFLRVLTLHILHTHSPPHIMFSEMSIMSSCSRLQPYSDWKALCEACRLSEVLISHFTIWVFVLHPFEHVYIVSLAIVFFLFILFILTQSYAFMAYWRNKLWTIEKQAALSHFDFIKSVLPYSSILWQAVFFFSTSSKYSQLWYVKAKKKMFNSIILVFFLFFWNTLKTCKTIDTKLYLYFQFEFWKLIV